LTLVDLATQPEPVREQAATLLVEHFDEPRGWPSLAAAREEVARVIADGFARAALDGDILLGWVGALLDWARYHRLARVWELWGAVALVTPVAALVLMVLKPSL